MSTKSDRGVTADDRTYAEADNPPGPLVDRPIGDRSVPRTIGRFRVESLLGEGGMGVVYKARDPSMGDRAVALKVVRRQRFNGFELSRLRGEMEEMAKLRHPNILTVYEPGLDEATKETFIVMDYAPGGNLAAALKREPQRPRIAAGIVETLARSVQAIHNHGLIHRDLKPQNVLLAEVGPPRPEVLRITDFGLAKSISERDGVGLAKYEVVGTPAYMAPEQTRLGEPLTPAVDVYALGVILYELLTGRQPFPAAAPDGSTSKGKADGARSRPAGGSSKGTTLEEQFDRIRWREPIPPRKLVSRLPRDLEVICLQCLRKAPGDRYQSATELGDDLRRFLNGESIVARPAPVWERVFRWVHRRPWQAALAATVAGAGFGGAIFAFREIQRNRAEIIKNERAEREEAQRKKLNEEYQRTLTALDGIRDLVLDGELSRVGGLESLNKELLKHYELASRRGEGSAPRELADAHAKLGKLVGRTGEKGRAVEAYKRAASLYESIPDASPDDRRALAGVRLQRGRLLTDIGEVKEAEKEFDAAERIWSDPTAGGDERAAVLQLAEVWHRRGEMRIARIQREEARAAFDQALALRARFPIPAAERYEVKNLPLLQDIARGYGWRGDVYLELGRLGEADHDYWESHRLRAEIDKAYQAAVAAARAAIPVTPGPVADAARADWNRLDQLAVDAKFQSARSWLNFANFQTRIRATATAADFASQGLKLLQDVDKARPNVSEYKAELGSAHNRLAELALLAAGKAGADRADPTTHLKSAVEAYLPLYDRSAEDRPVARGLGTAYALWAAALVGDAGRRAEAEGYVDSAERLLGGLIQAGEPHPEARLYLALARAADPRSAAGGSDGRSADLLILKPLRDAIEAGYRRRHREDIWSDRAFQRVRDRDRKQFAELLQPMAQSPTEGG